MINEYSEYKFIWFFLIFGVLQFNLVYGANYELFDDVAYGPRERNRGDLYLPMNPDGKTRPAVIGIHGGGWGHSNSKVSAANALANSSKNVAMRIQCDLLASNGIVCFSINFTLQQGASAAVPDAFTAVRFLRKNADKYKINPNAIGAMGRSNGGVSASYLAWTMDSDSMHIKIRGKRPRDTIIAVNPKEGPHYGYPSNVQAVFLSSGLQWHTVENTVFKFRKDQKQNPPENLPPSYLIGGDLHRERLTIFQDIYKTHGGGEIYLDTLRQMKHAPGLKGKEGGVSWDLKDKFVEFYKKHLPFEGPTTVSIENKAFNNLRKNEFLQIFNLKGQTLSNTPYSTGSMILYPDNFLGN